MEREESADADNSTSATSSSVPVSSRDDESNEGKATENEDWIDVQTGDKSSIADDLSVDISVNEAQMPAFPDELESGSPEQQWFKMRSSDGEDSDLDADDTPSSQNVVVKPIPYERRAKTGKVVLVSEDEEDDISNEEGGDQWQAEQEDVKKVAGVGDEDLRSMEAGSEAEEEVSIEEVGMEANVHECSESVQDEEDRETSSNKAEGDGTCLTKEASDQESEVGVMEEDLEMKKRGARSQAAGDEVGPDTSLVEEEPAKPRADEDNDESIAKERSSLDEEVEKEEGRCSGDGGVDLDPKDAVGEGREHRDDDGSDSEPEDDVEDKDEGDTAGDEDGKEPVADVVGEIEGQQDETRKEDEEQQEDGMEVEEDDAPDKDDEDVEEMEVEIIKESEPCGVKEAGERGAGGEDEAEEGNMTERATEIAEVRDDNNIELDLMREEGFTVTVVKNEVMSEEEAPAEPKTFSLRPRKRRHSSVVDVDVSEPVQKVMKKEPVAQVKAGKSGIEEPIDGPIFLSNVWTICDSAACLGRRPICVSLSDRRCALSSRTDKWYHLSCGEHFCGKCYEGLIEGLTSPANQIDFAQWLQTWKARMVVEETTDFEEAVTHFMANYKLPFWCRCCRCRQWRQIPRSLESNCVDPTWLARFNCSVLIPKATGLVCERPEDERASMARLEDFTKNIAYQPLLQSSPVSQFFSHYQEHRIGVNEHRKSESTHEVDDPSEEFILCGEDFVKSPKPPGVPAVIHPFRQPGCASIALEFPPDRTTKEEKKGCEELMRRKNLRILYLGVRNLILGLWAMNPKEWLTPETVAQHLWIRGLIRIRLLDHIVPRLITSFTEKGLVNFGLLPDLPVSLQNVLQHSHCRRFSCVVVGAGLTGLVAARQLQALGCDVTVLEGESRVGGRIKNIAVPRKIATKKNGQTIRLPLGAHIVNSCVNNPLSLVAHQADLKLVPVSNTAVLFGADYSGPVPQDVERRVEFHFLAVCERIRHLRDKATRSGRTQKDKSLGEVYRKENQAILSRISDMKKEHLKVLRFFEADLECAHSTTLDDLSWLYFDKNESAPQLGGSAVMINDASGLEKVTQQLARGLNIRTSRHVQSIVDERGLVVRTTSGENFSCARVLLTIPFPTLLTDERITLNADESLAKAARRLGFGKKEKVLLLFRQRFWDSVMKEVGAGDVQFIGRVPEGKEDRGFCHTFQDLDSKNREIAALETQIFGGALEEWKNRPQNELICAIVMILKTLFPKVAPSVLEPIWTHVTTWAEGNGSTGVFRAVGSKQGDFDHLSRPLMDNRLFCVGEGSHTNFPQTVTGAFLNGLSAAFRMTAT